jgi:transcriptional regulator
VIDDAATHDVIMRLIEKYEAGRRERWVPNFPADFVADNLRAIVGLEMPIARIEAKFKLSQNREPEDRDGALAGLESEGDEASTALAEFMRGYLARQSHE